MKFDIDMDNNNNNVSHTKHFCGSSIEKTKVLETSPCRNSVPRDKTLRINLH